MWPQSHLPSSILLSAIFLSAVCECRYLSPHSSSCFWKASSPLNLQSVNQCFLPSSALMTSTASFSHAGRSSRSSSSFQLVLLDAGLLEPATEPLFPMLDQPRTFGGSVIFLT